VRLARTEGKAAPGRVYKPLKVTCCSDGSERPPDVCKKEGKARLGKVSGIPSIIHCRPS